MGERSAIEWTDHTFNPWTGCTRVSPGCTNCYAERLSKRLPVLGRWGPGAPRARTSPANWRKPIAWNLRAERTGVRERVFCASLADWLDPEVQVEWLADLLALIDATPALTWMLLTKRPQLWRQRMEAVAAIDGSVMAIPWLGMMGPVDGPPNVWLGVSVEDQERADERIPLLLEIPARTRFLSCEPLLGPVDIGMSTATCRSPGPGGPDEHPCCPRWPSRWVRLARPVASDLPWFDGPGGAVAGSGVYRAHSNPHGALSVVASDGELLGIRPAEFTCLPRLDWVIVGGESGPKARPMHPAWARSLRDQCQSAGVACHFKQWGEWEPIERPADIESPRANERNERWMNAAGGHGFHGDDVWRMRRVGKAAAGRELDGRTWDDLPDGAR